MSAIAPAQAPGPDPAIPADEATRVRLGASRGTPGAVLQRLARDPSITVRAAVALNPATPPEADHLLIGDDDERVRVLLARKLATSMPSLDDAQQEQLSAQACQTLLLLVADEAVRVRATIAEMVKDLPNVSPDLARRLAADPAILVSAPILRFSPLLETSDLLALLADPPHSATASSIARRAFVAPEVAEAIAASTDNAAIQILLENPQAQIREATLDALISRASAQPRWHAPLVHRPTLTPKAAHALAEIIAADLIEELSRRADLPPDTIAALRQRLTTQLRGKTPEAAQQTRATAEIEAAIGWARQIEAAGGLTEDVILKAAHEGNAPRCIALLAVAADVPAALITRACRLRHPKGLVSLVWKAGFSMRVAQSLQTLLCQVSPAALLREGPGGSFPLGSDEMRWQIEFLGRPQ
jgi:uncharacterized protein (DUF2336 family)